jgi:thioredoxin-related protein
MKKIITLLSAALILSSCCNSNNNSQSKHDEVQQTTLFGWEYQVAKTIIEKHTYIVVSAPYKLAMEHDPECPYCKEQHKLETTDF